MNLPAEITYDALIATLQQLLPGFEPNAVCWIRIEPRHVTVELWNGTRPELHRIPIRHKQGSATEGSGHP